MEEYKEGGEIAAVTFRLNDLASEGIMATPEHQRNWSRTEA